MEERKVNEAIKKAEKGISQYLEIMSLLGEVDVSKNQRFQKRFNSFYRVRQRKPNWYKSYYEFLEENKNNKITFNKTLDHFKSELGRYEPSFSSKLVATINPNKPVWDIYVLKNTGHKAPSYSSKSKFEDAKSAYKSIEEWYKEFLKTGEAKKIINSFNEVIKEHDKITDLKKVDFVLWQMR